MQLIFLINLMPFKSVLFCMMQKSYDIWQMHPQDLTKVLRKLSQLLVKCQGFLY